MRVCRLLLLLTIAACVSNCPTTAQVAETGIPQSGSSPSVDPIAPKNEIDPLLDPILSTSAPPSLSATLTSEEVTANATVSGDGTIVDLCVNNNGKRTLLIDGNRAVAKPASIPALSRNQVIKPPLRQQVTSDLKEAGMSIATDGVSGDIEDAVRHAHSPLYYGADQNRRKLAEERFGPRILFPGDSCKGRVWLSKQLTLPVDLVLPVLNQPEGQDVGLLTVRVQAAPTPDAAPRQPAPGQKSKPRKER